MDDTEKKVKIAVIDDEKGLVLTIKTLLESRGFLVSFAYNGKEGLEVIKREKPDIILLDIMMPVKDGRDLLKDMKNDPEIKDIPVIVLTAKDEQFVRDYMLELGAYEYITKPYDSYAMLRQIRNVLDKKRQA